MIRSGRGEEGKGGVVAGKGRERGKEEEEEGGRTRRRGGGDRGGDGGGWQW